MNNVNITNKFGITPAIVNQLKKFSCRKYTNNAMKINAIFIQIFFIFLFLSVSLSLVGKEFNFDNDFYTIKIVFQLFIDLLQVHYLAC